MITPLMSVVSPFFVFETSFINTFSPFTFTDVVVVIMVSLFESNSKSLYSFSTSGQFKQTTLSSFTR